MRVKKRRPSKRILAQAPTEEHIRLARLAVNPNDGAVAAPSARSSSPYDIASRDAADR